MLREPTAGAETEVENLGEATKNIALQPGSRRGRCRLPSCICNSRTLSFLPGCADGDHILRPRATSLGWAQPASLSQKVGAAKQIRNSRERQRIEEKAFRARAGAAQSARQGGTEPGTTRFRDGRRTTGPPAPRRGPGAPAAQPRPRGPDLESAQI